MMKMPDKKTEGSCKKKTEEKASTPASDEDQQADDLICDDGGTNCIATSASVNYFNDLKDLRAESFNFYRSLMLSLIRLLVDLELLSHLQLFPRHDQQDYNLEFTFYDQPLILTEQLHASNVPRNSSAQEDPFNGLEISVGFTCPCKQFLINAPW